MAMSPLEVHGFYWEKYRFWLVPVPFMQKGSTTPGWPDLRLTPDLAPQHFNGERQNYAILMGGTGDDPPRNLTDEDDDCEEVKWARIEYAPPTGLNWGRPGNPNSHHLFYTEPAAQSLKLLDPVLEKESPGDAVLVELRCQTKDGKLGMPVVCPPSVHPSGEPYEFAGGPGFPNTVAGPLLAARVKATAAAAMLGRHAKAGLRHEIFIALAGSFARAQWALEDAQRFLRAVYRVIWREAANLAQANADAASTYRHYEDGHEITGQIKLASIVDERVFRKLKEWLALPSQDAWLRQQPPPEKKPRALPVALPFEALRSMVIPYKEPLVENMLHMPGLTTLVGASKSGKTVLGVQLVMNCANSLHLFDYFRTQQANGLIVEWDDRAGLASLKTFIEKARASRPNQPIDCTVNEEIDLDFTLTHPEFVPWLKKLIKDREARIVLLDSYTALRGFHSGGRDIVKIEAGELLLLHQLALEAGCSIVLIHHTSKTSANLDRHSRAAGSYAMQAIGESQIVIERFHGAPENDPMRFISVRGRHLRGLEAVVRFEEASLDFDLVLEGPAAEEFPRLRMLLHAFRGKGFAIADVTKEIGWQKSAAYALLSRLLTAGVVTKIGTGNWVWSPAWEKTLEQI
jgi:hypothetical protein